MNTGGVEISLAVAHGDFRLQAELNLPGRGVTAIAGPSGCGKTTLLRGIAGLDRHAGHLRVNGEIWQDDARGIFLPVHKRALGYVFQEASLLPHLDVRANIEYGWKRAASGATRPDPKRMLRLLGIDHLLGRRPADLSGGERQRVAIARALLAAPRMLLMDEPLAALDQARKQEVLPYLERLHEELALPILYVSHSPDEIARLADHLVLMEQGRVAGSGPITEMSARLDLPQAQAEAGVIVDAVVEDWDADYQLATLRVGANAIRVPHPRLSVGQRLRLRILARDVILALDRRDDTSALNHVPVRVLEEAPAGGSAHVMVRLDAQGMPLLARVTRISRDRLGVAPGVGMWAQFKATAVFA
ncbi:molybdenum ABC transporter ATP-binding protein [Noviherbaspirillum aridicola]|uniref:Molybdenum import ATP-binding protein ModC n=1 Tax=Noviherbaspirillum aridicola TaxID=2849687 RepID=A0ABQ4Q3G1_9BURK|nr:molybdenum ABC transporter ATP-binding protein [Noviherbaspirillum aridicola]GIZ51340.1 molybdenum import ATP-binding protein ModC [Noviherbaspirillum aridicola]